MFEIYYWLFNLFAREAPWMFLFSHLQRHAESPPSHSACKTIYFYYAQLFLLLSVKPTEGYCIHEPENNGSVLNEDNVHK